jgi:integrase
MSLKTSDKALAQARQKELDRRRYINKYFERKEIRLSELIGEYLNVLRSIKSASWHLRQECSAKAILSIVPDLYVHEIKLSHVYDFIQKRNRAPMTIVNDMGFFKRLFEYAVKSNYLEKNVVNDAEIPKRTWKQGTAFDEKIIKEIFKRAKKEDLIFYLILYYSGLRPSDAGTLEPGYLKNGFIVRTMQKTQLPVPVPLHPKLKNLDIFNVMPTRNKRDQSGRRLKKILEELGVEGSLKSFRHTFVTRLFEKGLSTEDIRIITGHTAASTTAIYTHPRLQYIKQVLNEY